MGLISSTEYEWLFDRILELHSFADADSLRAWLLDTVLPKLIPSDWLSYNEVDLENPANTLTILRPEGDPRFPPVVARFRELVHQNPLIIRQLETPNFSVHKISDFITQEAFHRLELYQEVYRPLGVEYQIAATIRLDPNHITAFALANRQADYTERDRALLEMLRPHLVVAFNNLALASESRTNLDAVALALHEMSAATIMVDSQHRILYHTGPGLQWIDVTSPGILPVNISRWLNQPAANRPCQIMSLVSYAGEIHIRAVPTSSPERRLLVLTRENAPPSFPASMSDFGLSPRQSEVAGWICQGKTNAEIAIILGLSPRTVQKHIEHIFEKMGVGSRMALAALLNEKVAQKMARLY